MDTLLPNDVYHVIIPYVSECNFPASSKRLYELFKEIAKPTRDQIRNTIQNPKKIAAIKYLLQNSELNFGLGCVSTFEIYDGILIRTCLLQINLNDIPLLNLKITKENQEVVILLLSNCSLDKQSKETILYYAGNLRFLKLQMFLLTDLEINKYIM